MSIDEVAQKTGRARSTAEGYLADYLRSRKVTDPSPWVDPQSISKIADAVEEIRPTRLKDLYQHFEESIDYTTLRIVTTCLQNRSE